MKTFLLRYWPAFAIVLVWLLFAHPYIFRGLVPFPSRNLVDFFAPWSGFYGMPVKNQAMPDVITQLYPWKKIAIESWKQFQIPAWNPYQFGGYPLLANVQSAVWTPLNLLFFILPFIDAWSIVILLQPLAAAVGMYVFARSVGLSRIAAMLSGISFMFSGFMTVWMAYGTLSWVALSLPWILWSLVRKRYWLASFFVAFSLFSGHVQTSLYVVGSAFLFAFFSRKNIAKALLALVLGTIFAAPQLIPTVRFYSQSVRSELFQKLEVIPWSYLPTILAPDIFGNPITRNDWFGHYAEWSSYAGVIPLMLTIFVIVAPFKKRRMLWFFAALGLVSLSLAYQSPLVDLLVNLKIPVLSTSAASRVIVLASFSIAILSGFGIDILPKVWESQRRFIIFYGLAWVILIVWIWGQIIFGNLFGIASLDPEKLAVAQRNIVFPTLLVSGGLFSLIAGLVKSKTLRKALPVLLLLATTFEMLRFSIKWMPFEERQYVYPQIPVLRYLSSERGFDRVFGNFGNEAQSPFGLFGIEGYDPLYVERYAELISSAGDGKIGNLTRTTVLLDRQGMFTKRILDLLSVRFILHAKGDERNIWAFPYWNHTDIVQTPIYSDQQYEVYRNEVALPRAYFVSSYVTSQSDQEILDRLLSESLDERSTVILEEEPSGLESIPQSEPIFERIRIERYSPNVVEIAAQTNREGLLVLTDPYYPGWSAYINGKKTKIYRANYALRAIVLPQGSWEVSFVYDHWFL